MKVRPHRRYPEFVAKIRSLSATTKRWSGITFRSVEPAFATPMHLISGQGSLHYGGRWNGPGSYPVVYSSTRPGTAVEEAFQLAADFEVSREDLQPRTTCAIEWDLSAVLDLGATNLAAWIDLPSWLREDFRRMNDAGAETLCQAFARAVRNARTVALFYPSVMVEGGINLAVFCDRLAKSDVMRVLDQERLSRSKA